MQTIEFDEGLIASKRYGLQFKLRHDHLTPY